MIWAFEKFKEKPISSIINSILLSIVNGLLAVPFVGGFIVAYVQPMILRRIASDYGLETAEDLQVSQKALMLIYGIPVLVFWIALLIAGFSIFSLLKSGSFGGILGVLLGLGWGFLIASILYLIFALLFTYTVYAGVLGKVSSLKPSIKNSILLMILGAIILFIFDIIYLVLQFIPYVGYILAIIVMALVLPVVVNAALLKYASEL